MHVSDWPKRPNMVPRPNLDGDSIFHHLLQSTPKDKPYSLVPSLLSPPRSPPQHHYRHLCYNHHYYAYINMDFVKMHLIFFDNGFIHIYIPKNTQNYNEFVNVNQ